MKLRVKNIFLLIVGIIGAIICFTAGNGVSSGYAPMRDASFGADFYTYIYDATSAAADRVGALNNNLCTLIRMLSFISGLAFVAVAASSLELTKAKKKTFASYTKPINHIKSEQEPNIATEGIKQVNSTERTIGENEWRCPDCGIIHKNYVGTCGCGGTKPR